MTNPRRRWIVFSLRTLFVVVTVCAVPMIWVGSHLRIADKRREMAESIKRDGGAYIQRGNGCSLPATRPVAGVGNVKTTINLLPAPWYVRVFGDDNFDEIVVADEQFDARVGEITKLFPEANIHRGPEAELPPFPTKFTLSPRRPSKVPAHLRGTLPRYSESTDPEDYNTIQDEPADLPGTP